MKMTSVRARLLLPLVFAVLAVVRLGHAQLLSPGPLSKQHATLEGDQHCNDCHSSGKRVEQASCLKCHGDLGARIANGQGLHGRQYKGKPCESCHAEHLGGGTSVRWPGGDATKLEGAHTKTTCNKCHDKSNGRGNHTFLGLSTACGSCHKDVHDNRFGSSCASCHDQQRWVNVKLDAFNHDVARFALRGAHQTTPCVKCHADPPKYSGLSFALCTNCHKDVHLGKLGPTCTNCHTESLWKPATMKLGTHPGTSLANGHAQVACRACHDKGNMVAPSKGKECVSCHAPVHEAPFGRACASCHASIQWTDLPRTMGLAAHSKTHFPLTGKHDEVACSSCHKPTVPRDVRYRRLAFARCADCHQDKHQGEFAKADRGECAPCHTTANFRTTTFGVLAHAATRFPLEGTHTASPCSACHKARPPLLDLHIGNQACADCHANPHGNQFVKEMSIGGCGQCHNPNGWRTPKIDHSTWPLTGAHGTTPCDSCHHPSAEDRKSGRGASYKGVPRACGGCHDDAHMGQFRLTQPALECDKCHTTTVFKIAKFDHESTAGWALTGAHAQAKCAGCHTAEAINGAGKTVRWRLPSTECKFCHADPHQPPPRGP